jgi:hypothetical protein
MNNKNNTLYNSTNKNYSNIIKPKIINDNPKLNTNNKITFTKTNKKDKEIIIQNFKENNLKKINSNSISKKLDLATIQSNQSKLLIYKPNKDYAILKTQSQSNEKRKNKFVFSDNRETPFKNFNTSRIINKKNINDNKNKYINSIEQKDTTNNNSAKENGLIAATLTNKELPASKELINRSNKDSFPSININEKVSNSLEINSNLINNNKQNNSDIKAINISNYTNKEINKDISHKNKLILSRINTMNYEAKLRSLSLREKAYFVLSKSKVLSIPERIIFSKITENVSYLVPIKEILKTSEILINERIKQLEDKLNEYNKKIESPFSPSKISSISLNLIMKEDEDDFKTIISSNFLTDENEQYYFFIYVQLLLLLLGEMVNEDDIEENGVNILYKKLAKRDYIFIKDYLSKLFMVKKLKVGEFSGEIIDKFDEAFEELPDMIKYDGPLKKIRFISFSHFILAETYKYFKNLKYLVHLKMETQDYINGLNEKKKRLKLKY